MFRKGTAALIKNNRNEFLLVNLESYELGFYTVPGGGVDREETLLDCVYREIKEEVNIDKIDLNFVGSSEDSVQYYFREPAIREGVEYVGSEKFYFGFVFNGSEDAVSQKEGEVRSCKWVKYEDIKDCLLFQNQFEDTNKKIKEIFINI